MVVSLALVNSIILDVLSIMAIFYSLFYKIPNATFAPFLSNFSLGLSSSGQFLIPDDLFSFFIPTKDSSHQQKPLPRHADDIVFFTNIKIYKCITKIFSLPHNPHHIFFCKDIHVRWVFKKTADIVVNSLPVRLLNQIA